MEENIKQIIILRKDLNMRKGKMVAQGAHASMGAILSIAKKNNNSYEIPLTDKEGKKTDLGKWLEGKFKKITFSVDSEAELLSLQKESQNKGIIHCLIQDSGLTEFGGVPTYTSLAIGPAKAEIIDNITSHLKLL